MPFNNTVDMRAIVKEVKENALCNENLEYKLKNVEDNIWILYVLGGSGNRSAKIEIIIDEFDQPEDRGVRGFVMRYGDMNRTQVEVIMDSIMERL